MAVLQPPADSRTDRGGPRLQGLKPLPDESLAQAASAVVSGSTVAIETLMPRGRRSSATWWATCFCSHAVSAAYSTALTARWCSRRLNQAAALYSPISTASPSAVACTPAFNGSHDPHLRTSMVMRPKDARVMLRSLLSSVIAARLCLQRLPVWSAAVWHSQRARSYGLVTRRI